MKKNMEKVNDVKRIDIKKAEELLQSGSLENCDDMLDTLLEDVEFAYIESLMLRLYVCMEIYVTAYLFSQKIGVSSEKFYSTFGTADEIGNELMTVEDTMKFLHTLIRECIKWRIESAKGSSSSIVAKAKDYIDKNYMNDELSLTVVTARRIRIIAEKATWRRTGRPGSRWRRRAGGCSRPCRRPCPALRRRNTGRAVSWTPASSRRPRRWRCRPR